MKFKYYLFPALLIAGSVLFFTSCEKEKALPVQSVQPDFEATSVLTIDESLIEEMSQLATAYKAQLTETAGNAFSPCPTTIVVPDDYATIQEAIDAACHPNGTDIIVKAGTYDEGRVFITKPDLNIKANGGVTLMGGFFIVNADNTQIHKFNIVINDEEGAEPTERWGISGRDFTGGNFKQNTISSEGNDGSSFRDMGFFFGNVSDVNIKQNTVSNLDWGILIYGGYTGPVTPWLSQNNTIQDNNVTDIFYASAIGLQGNCDNNLIKGNTISNKLEIWNGGIMLLPTGHGSCDNNTLKNNIVTNCTESPGIRGGGLYNTIGPNNVANSNQWGVALGGSDNHIFNNTALNNTNCDIVNYGTNNTFSNNEADCTIGL